MKLNVEITGKKLAAGAVLFLAAVLGLAATVARVPASGPADVTATIQSIVDETDHVTPVQLAQWILEKKQDYTLVDIRQAWMFDDYHIPTAVSIPLTELFGVGLAKLPHGKKVVVYGLGAGHAAQAQLLLKMKGYDAYSLKEGISAWWDQVMTPMSMRSESGSPAGYQQAKRLRESFMGGPGAPAATPATTSTPAAPPSPTPAPATPASPGKLKLGRGCS
jgi:rhodanese-related sulfurtransferase